MRRRLFGVVLAAIGVLNVCGATFAQGTVKPPAKPAAVSARIAVAANFADAAKSLAADYGRQSGYRIAISSASTGKLYAQIRNGAPFDALLSADVATPQRLVSEGLADESTLQEYARGRLVLWSRNPALVKDGEALLRSGNISKLAIANPELAPYGAAARDVLEYLRRWNELKPVLVQGENIGQATQFVVTGAAPLGLLPRSLVIEANKMHRGSGWEIPASWHLPITQSAVLLARGENNPAAKGFLKYLQTPAAKKKIRALGYD